MTEDGADRRSGSDAPAHEREVKLSVWPGFEVPDLQASVPWIVTGERYEQLLDARYVDAADLRLLRMGITFRHRTGEGAPEGRWTLKLPAPSEGLVLDRLELEEDGPPGPPPDHLAALVKGVLRGAPLVPVAHVQTRRTVVPITDPGQRPLGVLSDDVVTAFEGEQVGLRFREIEVEAAAGAPESVLEAVVGALRDAGAGEPDHQPKLARALGPRALAPADPNVPALRKQDAGDATTADVLRAAAAAVVRRLLVHDPVVRLDAGDEGVHQARVATRRLRSDLRTFRSVLDDERIASVKDELRWLGGLLGAVRDADVLGERLEEAVGELAGRDQGGGQYLLDRLAREREPHLRALHEALDSDRYAALTEALVELAAHPPLLAEAGEPAKATMPALVAKPWDHLVKRVRSLDDEPPDEELHRVRILAKRARYAGEAAAIVIPAAGRHAAAIADLQGILGDHQDAVVAEAWLRAAVAAGAGGQEGFAAGLLVAREEVNAARHRDDWRAAWKAADAKKLRAWLDR